MFQAARESQSRRRGPRCCFHAIVERHFGKHTGLPPSAKACPGDHAGMETACKRVVKARRNQRREAREQRQSGRRPMGISFDKARRARPAPEIAPVPTAGSKGMSLKFEIQPATNPTSEKERAARLVDPGLDWKRVV